MTDDPSPPLPQHVRIAIVGAGFGGLGLAIRLRQDGVEDFVVLERADDVGGTWRDNSYPGCACDVPSHLYSYSFAPNPGWSRAYSRQPEIWAYLRGCVERFGLLPHLRFGTELRSARWDAGATSWQLDTSNGRLTADVLVAATGPLCEPAIPAIPGLDGFAGPLFHSARWRHDEDLTGRRVGVVGTGASAAQLVPPVADLATHVTVFQRTPPWVLPRNDRPLSPRRRTAYATVPGLRRLARTGLYATHELTLANFRSPRVAALAARLARRFLARTVADPALRARLTPDYALGCKRVVLSDDYLPALTREHVAVVTEPIVAVRPDAVVTADGTVHNLDALVLATGFHVTDQPLAELVTGADGRSLAEVWAGSPKAHRGTMVAGFPNLFLLLGPNTGLGHTSVLIMLEAQLGLVRSALALMAERGAGAIEPTARAQDAWVDRVDRRMRGTVWVAGGCRSWYLDRTGRNSTLWPGSTLSFRRQLAGVRPGEYVLHRRQPAGAEVPR